MTWVWKLKGFGATGESVVSTVLPSLGMAADGERWVEFGETEKGTVSLPRADCPNLSVSSMTKIGGV